MTDRPGHTRLLFAPGDQRGARVVDDAALVTALGEVEAAWLDAQAHRGLIPEDLRIEASTAIAATVEDMLTERSALETLCSAAEAGGNPVIPFLTAVRATLSPAASRALHRGLTSQDVMDSAIGLIASRVVEQTHALLGAIAADLIDVSETHSRTLCLARTLTQPALPTTFGLRAATWAAEIHEVQELTPTVDWIQVGGAAGTRAAIRQFAGSDSDALLRQFHVRLRGPDAALAEVPVPWHTNRVRVLSWGTHLAQCVTVGASIARDVLIGTRPEVGELALGSTGGSSAMPHKSNPTQAVLLHRNGMRVPGMLATLVSSTAEAIEERSDGAWHAEWPALAELLTLALSSTELLRSLLGGLRINAEAMRANLDAAAPGIFGERLTITFGDRLTKEQIAEVLVASGADPGTDPAAALEAALAVPSASGAVAEAPHNSDTLPESNTLRTADALPTSESFGTSATMSVPSREELAGYFLPENYLGEAEEIRSSIIRTIRRPTQAAAPFPGPERK